MDEPKSDGQQAAPCCSDGQACDCGPRSAAVSCDCGAPPRRSRLKTLISAVILLAAVGVGAYALTKGRGAGVASAEGKATSVPAAAITTPAAPVPAAPSCCGGGANRPVQAQPSCCGGGAAVAPAAAPGQPTCGSPQPGCCGH